MHRCPATLPLSLVPKSKSKNLYIEVDCKDNSIKLSPDLCYELQIDTRTPARILIFRYKGSRLLGLKRVPTKFARRMECGLVSYYAQLHMANVTQTLFEGFSWGQMTAGLHHFPQDQYWSVTSLYIDVYLKTTEKQAHIRYSCQEEIALRPDIHFLYYPDSRAYRMIITLQKAEDAGTEQYYAATLDLEEHTTLNGAYYYEPLYYTLKSKLKPTTTVPEPPTADELTSTPPNQLFVSESSNPFLFRAGQIYTIGSSEILAIASATKALSEGQFGPFPLYVFSKEEIWAMEVSQTSSYSSRQTIARDVCNNAKSILQTDGAVLFTSDKGVMIIEGSADRCISEGLHGLQP